MLGADDIIKKTNESLNLFDELYKNLIGLHSQLNIIIQLVENVKIIF